MNTLKTKNQNNISLESIQQLQKLSTNKKVWKAIKNI